MPDHPGPAFYAFRPWSHTDRRHMLMVISDRSDSVEALGVAPTQILRLFDLTDAMAEEAQRADEPVRARLLNDPDKGWKDYAYLAVSWSPRAPSKLRIESREFLLRYDAHDWAEFRRDQNAEKGRVFFVAQLMDPANAKTSP